MTSHDEHEDPILETVVDGSVRERARLQRRSVLTQPIPRTLTLQAALLALLGTVLPLYVLYPPSTMPYLPSPNPLVAAPNVLLLGALGGLINGLAALVLCGMAIRQARATSLPEMERLLDFQAIVTFFGVATGGAAVLVTVAFFLLGLGGGQALNGYIEAMNSANPFVATGHPASVAVVAIAAVGGAALLVAARALLTKRLQDG